MTTPKDPVQDYADLVQRLGEYAAEMQLAGTVPVPVGDLRAAISRLAALTECCAELLDLIDDGTDADPDESAIANARVLLNRPRPIPIVRSMQP